MDTEPGVTDEMPEWLRENLALDTGSWEGPVPAVAPLKPGEGSGAIGESLRGVLLPEDALEKYYLPPGPDPCPYCDATPSNGATWAPDEVLAHDLRFHPWLFPDEEPDVDR